MCAFINSLATLTATSNHLSLSVKPCSSSTLGGELHQSSCINHCCTQKERAARGLCEALQ